MFPPQRGHWRRRQEAPAQWLRSCGAAGAGLWGAGRPGCRRRCRRGTGSGQGQAPRARGAGRPGARRLQRERTERPPAMSRKKTLKSKGASAPAASAIPASNEPRPARPGSARPGPQVPPNGLLQPGRPSLGGGGDFYDVAFKVSGPPPPPPHARAAGGIRRGPMGEGVQGEGAGLCGPWARRWLERYTAAGTAGTVHRIHTHSCQTWVWDTAGKACPLYHPQLAGFDKESRGNHSQVSSPRSLILLTLTETQSHHFPYVASLTPRVYGSPHF